MTKEIAREVVAAGRFIRLENLTWRDRTGRERLWESAERVIGREAVLLICWTKPSDELLLIRQYRPPAGGEVLEFPAGLVDPGETPAQAARRELLEETGYQGEIIRQAPPTFNSPGLTSETVHHIYFNLPDGQTPRPQPESGEEITTLRVARPRLADFCQAELAAGRFWDSKVWAYINGLLVHRQA